MAADPDPEALRARVDALLLGGERRHTRADVTARSGIPPERTHEIWRALGFPLEGEDERVFTDGDVAALAAGEGFVRAGVISAESETLMTRALGQHLSRLAEWQVHTLMSWLTDDGGLPADEDGFTALVAELLPRLEAVQNHVWRRHLAAYAARALAAPDARQDAGVQAVGFTDMVGYTHLARSVRESELLELLDRFESLVGDVVADHGGRVVKLIGDEALFTAPDPPAAAELALTLHERAAAAPDLPPLRTGLAHGRVLRRFGDVYGPVVNAAARLTSLARRGTVLTTPELAEPLAATAGYSLRALRPVAVRGIPRLRPVVLRRAPSGVPERAHRARAKSPRTTRSVSGGPPKEP
ncbi:adenylate/guanylate cyclase domain-containing protein [Streptomyces sp. TRM70308]|uniref:adenylate/guanylate cyclase domain-containing protein n=1 Tax=Streptomyces sp. TRM70308 TaxID=3131932 RepID=UPI003D0692E2